MQNKALIYTLGAVALAIVAGAVVLTTRGGIPGLTANVSDADLVAESTSLTELIARADARTCSINTASGDSTTEGMIYVAGGNLRGDFTTKTKGQTTKSHLVVNNDISYLWTDSMNQGFYLPFSRMSGEGSNSSSGINASAKMEYACKAWNPDPSTFSLPMNVDFKSIQ